MRARAPDQRLGSEIARALRRFWRQLGRDSAEVSLTLCGDRAMRTLNRRALGVDRTTDVLSFPAAPAPWRSRSPASAPRSPLPPRALGDLVIALPVARRRARQLGRALSGELRLYAAHGFLHLLGYDHQQPQDLRRMRAAEVALLGETGLVGRTAAGRRPPQAAPASGRPSLTARPARSES